MIKTAFEKIPESELDIPSFQEHLHKQHHKRFDEVLLKVVQQVTGKEMVTESDYKEMSFIQHELYPGRSFVGHKGRLIGEFVMRFEDRGEQFTRVVEFIPKTSFDA